MSITGRVNLITSPEVFFLPVLLGTGKPSEGFAPSTNNHFVVSVTGFWLGFIPITIAADVSTVNGDFTLNELPPEFASINDVSIRLTLNGRPFYRSGWFPRAHTSEHLNIYLFQPPVPESDGVTAGQVSAGLAGGGLPGDTTLKANAWGLGVVGSQSGVNIQFGVQMIPDTSPNLSLFFDLALDGYNIHVGWPADCGTNATKVLNQIKSALQTSDSGANKIVSGTNTKAFERPPLNLDAAVTQKLLENVSIQFISMSLPNSHTWALSDTTDKTIVIVPQLALGYPRTF